MSVLRVFADEMIEALSFLCAVVSIIGVGEARWIIAVDELDKRGRR